MNVTKNNLEPTALLRIFLGIIFLSAGIYRVLNWQAAALELSRLNLSSAYLSVFVVALEIIGGIFLIFNIRVKEALIIFVAFLVATLIWTLMVSGGKLLSEVAELFTFNPTPTDLFLHFTYLIILVFLLLINKKAKT